MFRGEEVKSRLAAYRLEKEKLTEATNQVHKTNTDTIPEQEQKQSEITITTNWWIISLKILLWTLMWGFFIEIEFGLAYVAISGLVFIVASLRGGKKRAPGELSAYSVFNKNFEAIEGTLSADQFEKELRYGPTSVR